MSDRSRTQRAVACRALKPFHNGPPPSFVTAYHGLSRFVTFTPVYYGLLGFSSAPWLPWQIFWHFKNLTRYPRQSRPVTFAHTVPRVVSRQSRFVHGGLKRGCRGRREHSVNVALSISYIPVVSTLLWDEIKICKLHCYMEKPLYTILFFLLSNCNHNPLSTPSSRWSHSDPLQAMDYRGHSGLIWMMSERNYYCIISSCALYLMHYS